MIVHFLPFRRLCTKQGAACKTQIRTCVIHFFCNEKIFLLRPYRGNNPLCRIVSKQAEDTKCLFVKSLHGSEKRCLFIQCMSCIGAEGGRNTQCFPLDKSIGSWVPSGIPSGFKGCAQPAGWERRCIRFPFNKFLSGKFHNYTTVRGRCNETVMLFSSNTCERLEPMRKMRCSFFNGPVFHCLCNCIGNADIQFRSFINGLSK